MGGDGTDRLEHLVDFIRDYQADFYRVALSYMRNREDAMDAVQNAVCKGLEKYRSLRNDKYMKSWFYRILVNECLMMLRKRKREVLSAEDVGIDQISRDGVFSEEDYQLFCQVDELPEHLKSVILLHFYEGLTIKETAEVLQANSSTIKSRLYQALKVLKIQIEEESI